jgi:hypothetical protein
VDSVESKNRVNRLDSGPTPINLLEVVFWYFWTVLRSTSTSSTTGTSTSTSSSTGPSSSQ